MIFSWFHPLTAAASAYSGGVERGGLRISDRAAAEGGQRKQQSSPTQGAGAPETSAKFEPLSADYCSGCGRIRSGWYDERNAHMAAEFKAGTTTRRIADGYGLSQRRVQEILIEWLGTEVVWRIIRTHGHNKEDEENADTHDAG